MRPNQGNMAASKKLIKYAKQLKEDFYKITGKKYSPQVILEALCLMIFKKKNYDELKPYIAYVRMERYKELMQEEMDKIPGDTTIILPTEEELAKLKDQEIIFEETKKEEDNKPQKIEEVERRKYG
jgi:hypothetical protein